MKAVVYDAYGSPEVLRLEDVDKPVPKDNEVLVKIMATSVNLSDWEFLTGRPLYARFNGLRKPKKHILGSDISGRLEAVGANVERFQPGDEVFGDILGTMGGFAEYVCVSEKSLALKPAGITLVEAAALPQAAVIALQGVRDKGQVRPGQSVLINGAGGGAGTFAVQLAKWYGAEVTGVDRASKFDLMRSIGADHVIDYTEEDFTRNGRGYDLILDVVAYRRAFDYRRALKPGGRYYMVGGSMSTLLQTLLLGSWIGRTEDKRIGVLMVDPNIKDLMVMAELVEDGEISVVIDRYFPLSETAEALHYLGEGRALGKIVVTMPDHPI